MATVRRLQRLTFVLVCVLVSVMGCSAAFAQTSPYKPGSPLLMWKVCSKTNCAWLLGSVHLADKSLYPLPAVIENAFQSSSVLIVEVDLRKLDPLETQAMMAQAGTYPAGDDLFHHISAETRSKLTAFLGGYGMPIELLGQLKPWMLGATIQMLPLMKEGLNPNEGIDSYFLNKAGDKRVDQVEDAEWQVKLLASMPDKISDSWLASAIEQAKDARVDWNKFAEYWRTGDAEKIDQLTSNASMGSSPEEKAFERKLREDRNPHMADRLEKCVQSTESCFMVVGAAHVVGSEGIVKLMQGRGYRVEQAVVEKSASATASAH